MMTIGSALAGLALLALAEARGGPSYFAAMIALGMISTMVFYDAAFAALTQSRGAGARRSISQLTLIGGFALTIFWPLTTALARAVRLARDLPVLRPATAGALRALASPWAARACQTGRRARACRERSGVAPCRLSRRRGAPARLYCCSRLLAAGLRRFSHVGASAEHIAGARPERCSRGRHRCHGRPCPGRRAAGGRCRSRRSLADDHGMGFGGDDAARFRPADDGPDDRKRPPVSLRSPTGSASD